MFTARTAENLSGGFIHVPNPEVMAGRCFASNATASPTTVRNALVNQATTSRVTSTGNASPNRLLCTASGVRAGRTTPPAPLAGRAAWFVPLPFSTAA